MTRLALLLAVPLLACGNDTVAATADGSTGGATTTGSTDFTPTTGDVTTSTTGSSSGSGSDSETTGGSTGGATTSTSSSSSTGDTTESVDPGSTGSSTSTTGSTGSTGDTTGTTGESTTGESTGTTEGSTGDTTGEVMEPPPILDAMCIANDLTTFVEPMPQAEELHIVSVYQATNNAITVDITRTGVPMTLVLSSYEPVAFTLTLAPGVLLDHVILNGYEPHSVQGQGGAMVTDLSGQFNYLAACGYFWPMNDGGCDTPGLVMGAEQLTGLQLTAFAGCYEGSSFSID